MTIKDILIKYREKIDFLDLELLIADAIKKPREFVLAHPKYTIPETHNSKLETMIKQRIQHKPLAYILGQKEFFGLNFKVNQHTLIPRPETEILIEQVLQEFPAVSSKYKAASIIDVGTGSGNIIISLAHNIEHETYNKINFYGIDISSKVLATAKQNAKFHKVDKKIKFLKGNLLEPILKKCFMFHAPCSMIILANLPYLSKEIYNSAPKSVRKYEPTSALISGIDGLNHYRKLLQQIKKLVTGYGLRVTGFLEISPEQKPALENLAASILPGARLEFMKDLAGKWRVCKIIL